MGNWDCCEGLNQQGYGRDRHGCKLKEKKSSRFQNKSNLCTVGWPKDGRGCV